MTSPQHHLPDHLLLEYASASVDPATRLVVSCHLTLCPLCRDKVARLDNVGGACLEQMQEAELSPQGLSALLGRLDEAVDARKPPQTRSSVDARANAYALPRPLLTCLPNGELKWRRWLPGVKGMTLDLGDAAAPARLVHFSPGITVPLHDHERTELVLVLDGQIQDGGEDYRRGDVAVSDNGHAHTQKVDPGSPCVALIVNQGPLLPLTGWGRLLKLVTGV